MVQASGEKYQYGLLAADASVMLSKHNFQVFLSTQRRPPLRPPKRLHSSALYETDLLNLSGFV